MLELNKIYNTDCLEGLREMDDNSVELTVTSPPYDSLRNYFDEDKGECEWNFEIFKPIANELFRVTKKGGVLVWVVGDACIGGQETGSSFRQALYFQEIGFKLHDTMIYEKNSSSFPARLSSKRYTQIFEYMFVFSKGKIRDDIKLIADKRNKWAGWTNWGQHSQYNANEKVKTNNIKPIAEFSLRTNIWRYPVSFNDKTNHPAVFPEKLAEDHILSWSLEGDTVLDPFMGSGTTAKMAMLNHRNYIGFERNKQYYEESLTRVGKYVGKENILSYSISAPDIKDYEKMTTSDELYETLQVNPTVDKDDEKKAQLWKELTQELEDYFNTQSYGILKNLKVNLSFTSKSNDKRVKELFSGNTETIKTIKDNFEEVLDVTPPVPKGTVELTPFWNNEIEAKIRQEIINLSTEIFEKKFKEMTNKNQIPHEDNYPSLFDTINETEINENYSMETEHKKGRGKDTKPRHRRTKAEIEADRNNLIKDI